MTPKQDFLQTPHAKAFATVIEQPAVKEALRYALLEMLERQSGSPNPLQYDPAALMQGALQFRSILESIWKPEEQKKQSDAPQFNYNIYERSRNSRTA